MKASISLITKPIAPLGRGYEVSDVCREEVEPREALEEMLGALRYHLESCLEKGVGTFVSFHLMLTTPDEELPPRREG